ncbi:MAG TPA: hypothetical protein VN428_11225 [Bryobacteraceae bacterium]|nr:hypothetical protein [Bryobacteraceae bacterium]
MVCRLLCWSLLAVAASGQPVKVYSEFQRIDPLGNVLAIDRSESPREILSPALARNARASFFVVLRPPAASGWYAYIAQNPENAVDVKLYRPVYAKQGETWIPDALEPLTLTDSRLPDMTPQVPGQTIIPLWLEVFVAADAKVRRTRLEVQLNLGDHWVVYPMELRVQSARVPALTGGTEPLAAPGLPASVTAEGPLRGYICGAKPGGAPTNGAPDTPSTIRAAILRNARQDAALARSLEEVIGREAVLADMAEKTPVGQPEKFCKAFTPPKDRGAEWYQSVRDYLYRTAFVGKPTPAPMPGN